MDSSTIQLNYAHSQNRDAEEEASLHRYTTWPKRRMQIPGIHHTGDVCVRVVIGIVGLLCVLLLVGVIVLSEKRTQFNSILRNCSSEKDLLQTKLKTLQDKYTELSTFAQEGWRFFASTYYYISTERKSWDEARKDCQNRSADLVIINSRDEQEFLSGLKLEFWLGLTDKDGTWKWIDGTALTGPNRFWDSGQPNNYAGDEDCAEIRPRHYALTNWNDDLCSRPQLWLCEKKASAFHSVPETSLS